jgi:hypothetical protein
MEIHDHLKKKALDPISECLDFDQPVDVRRGSRTCNCCIPGMANASEPIRKHMEGLRAKARKLLEKRKVLKGLHGTAHFHKWLVMNAAEYR